MSREPGDETSVIVSRNEDTSDSEYRLDMNQKFMITPLSLDTTPFTDWAISYLNELDKTSIKIDIF